MTKEFHKVNLHLPANAFEGRVELDGKQMLGVKEVSVRSQIGGLTEVTITFYADVNVNVESVAKVETL